MNKAIVPFAVRVNIQQAVEEQPIVIKVALPARTLVTPPLQPNTMNKTTVKRVMRADTLWLLMLEQFAKRVLRDKRPQVPLQFVQIVLQVHFKNWRKQ